ncbi:hypothetical protein PybrP1_008144 [[Pythium] brassicae (nom. inval.)]|nr:hypothetical protein PybrP1_008144 [[Pythium] brassicae (nom. inval.)]
MKAELYRALERIGNLIVGNFTVSFQNELRFMSEAAGSTVSLALRADGVPMQQVAKHTAGALARL